jgi:phosphatidate cytidylyltransferase
MLKRVLVGVIFVPLIVLLVLFAPAWGVACFVALITACASWELLRATAKTPVWIHVLTSAAAAVLPLGFLLGDRGGVVTMGFTALALFAILFVHAILAYGTERAMNYETIQKCLFAGILMPAFLSTLVVLMNYGTEGHGRMYVMMTIGLAFITDGGAYFAGVLLGKHRGLTQVSPNKSTEGYVGGLATGVIFTVVFGIVVQNAFGVAVSYPALVAYGLVGALVTEIGDLAFSLIKREYGVKDYGNLLPGHGGIMDRFDSMVFCAPLVTLFSLCFPCF